MTNSENSTSCVSLTAKNKLPSKVRMCWEEEREFSRSNIQLLKSEWIEKMKSDTLQELMKELQSIENQIKLQQQHFKERAELLQQQIIYIRHQSDTILNQKHNVAIESIIKATLEPYIANFVKNQSQLLHQILSSFQEERKNLTTFHQSLCQSLKLDGMLMQQLHATALQASKTSHNIRCRSLVDAWDERSGVSRVLAEERMISLHQAIHDTKAMFDNDTKEEQQLYAQLYAEDAQDSAVIAENSQQLAEIKQGIHQWRQKLASDAEKWKVDLGDAKAEKMRALTAYSSLQQQGIQQQRLHEETVKGISSDGATIEKQFIDLVERMEKIAREVELQH